MSPKSKPVQNKNQIQVQVRLPPDVIARIDSLMPRLEREMAMTALGREVNRSTVIRYLLSLGLQEAERR